MLGASLEKKCHGLSLTCADNDIESVVIGDSVMNIERASLKQPWCSLSVSLLCLSRARLSRMFDTVSRIEKRPIMSKDGSNAAFVSCSKDNFQKFETPLIKDRLNMSLSSLGALGTALGSSAGMLP